MSRRIFLDVQESLLRAVRSITFDDKRTPSLTVLQDTYDVFTGELVKTPIEGSLYDSSADASHIQYPHFFIKLLYTREDRFTGRVIPQYGKEVIRPLPTTPKAFSLVLNISDGLIPTAGNTLTTSNFQIRKTQVGYYLRLNTGNNIGTYIITEITPSSSGPHSITVGGILINNLPGLYFEDKSYTLYFSTPIDLSTVSPGDVFIDASGKSFDIVEVHTYNNTLIISSGTPNLAANGVITRTGNIFKNADTSIVSAVVLNPSEIVLNDYGEQKAVGTIAVSPQVPIDAYYLIRIDSKEQEQHIEIINRMWEEFNPPRTGLPTIVRHYNSAEEYLLETAPAGSNIIKVKNPELFHINDPIFLINRFHPTKNPNGAFDEPFQTVITNKTLLNELVLRDPLPYNFTKEDYSKVISNAYYYLFMFHFVDHKTKDVEGSQYWSHEFTFWVQFWVDRQGVPTINDSVVQKIDASIENLNGTVIIP